MSLLETKLTERFEPSSLEIINESHLHAGHQSGFDGQGESHVRIRIVSRHFRGMNRVDMHRAINTACADELAAGLHAIAIDAKAAV
ncbi:MAG: BolA family transcriptional regulator [Ahrensia sp.]|nr:BolA family transcriptional regulator [Ahrensia sp.]